MKIFYQAVSGRRPPRYRSAQVEITWLLAGIFMYGGNGDKHHKLHSASINLCHRRGRWVTSDPAERWQRLS